MPRKAARPIPRMSDADLQRFWAKVALPNEVGCMLWRGTLNDSGYGLLGIGGRVGQNYRAHRIAYVLSHGEPASELTTDHLCRNRACVRPDHLQPVSHAENVRRGERGAQLGAEHRARTHCPHGHPYDEANTYWTPQGWRYCRACHRLRETKRRARRAEMR